MSYETKDSVFLGIDHPAVAAEDVELSSQVATLVERLEKDGLAHRAQGEVDRRVVTVALTAATARATRVSLGL